MPISEAELVSIFSDNNKIAEFYRYCREINPDKNGVVTTVELDDILRLLFPEELKGKDLTELFAPFCSEHNKILIDFKGFINTLNNKIKQQLEV